MYTDKDKKIRENPFHLCVSVCYLCLFWEEPEQLHRNNVISWELKHD
jgi:hypothetical protein